MQYDPQVSAWQSNASCVILSHDPLLVHELTPHRINIQTTCGWNNDQENNNATVLGVRLRFACPPPPTHTCTHTHTHTHCHQKALWRAVNHSCLSFHLSVLPLSVVPCLCFYLSSFRHTVSWWALHRESLRGHVRNFTVVWFLHRVNLWHTFQRAASFGSFHVISPNSSWSRLSDTKLFCDLHLWHFQALKIVLWGCSTKKKKKKKKSAVRILIAPNLSGRIIISGKVSHREQLGNCQKASRCGCKWTAVNSPLCM